MAFLPLGERLGSVDDGEDEVGFFHGGSGSFYADLFDAVVCLAKAGCIHED